MNFKTGISFTCVQSSFLISGETIHFVNMIFDDSVYILFTYDKQKHCHIWLSIFNVWYVDINLYTLLLSFCICLLNKHSHVMSSLSFIPRRLKYVDRNYVRRCEPNFSYTVVSRWIANLDPDDHDDCMARNSIYLV